jgi:hypothetical protein
MIPARSAFRAAVFYSVVALLMTWPLARQLTTAMPGDLGDPLLNAWILAWGSDHFTAFLGGDFNAFSRWWNANIFHPAPLALAYSEHLAPQVVAGLPVWWLTGNVLLVYNVLFLASIVLSGLGAFLLVRDLTGRPRAALVAGLFFAFVPYRIAQAAHLQVLWAQWMPMAIFALRRYLSARTSAWWVAALAALLAQQLSCGYYLVYFTPFAAAWVAWEVTSRSLWNDRRLLAALAGMGIADLALAWPFLAPYLELRALGFAARPLAEVISFSADTTAYLATHQTNRVWGSILNSLARPENDLFPGLLPLLFAAAGIAAMSWRQWSATAGTAPAAGWRRWVVYCAAGVGLMGLAGLVTFLLTGGVTWRLPGLPAVRIRGVDRNLMAVGLGGVALLALSPRARRWCRWGTDLRGCALVLLVSAIVLSWGPSPTGAGRTLEFQGPYLWLYNHVPGFDGLRVPARFAMVAYVFLTVLAGYGLAVFDRRRHGARAMVVAGTLFLVEATGVPITIGENWGDPGVRMPPPQVEPAATAPPVYIALASLPPGTVVAEFPFGFPSWELRYVYYSSVHEHRLLNGYSGGFPHSYMAAAAALHAPLEMPARAWQTLRSAGVTTVVLHRAAFDDDRAGRIVAWLEAEGGRVTGTFGADLVVTLPR